MRMQKHNNEMVSSYNIVLIVTILASNTIMAFSTSNVFEFKGNSNVVKEETNDTRSWTIERASGKSLSHSSTKKMALHEQFDYLTTNIFSSFVRNIEPRISFGQKQEDAKNSISISIEVDFYIPSEKLAAIAQVKVFPFDQCGMGDAILDGSGSFCSSASDDDDKCNEETREFSPIFFP
jgi:hypothetical protein